MTEFTIGNWYFQPDHNRISNTQESKHLEPKLVQVLCYFAHRPNQVISREELLQAIWNNRVSESAVNRAITELRKALADAAVESQYIETISKQGYILVAPVSSAKSTKRFKLSPKSLMASIAVVAILLSLIGYNIWFGPNPETPLLQTTIMTYDKGMELDPHLSKSGLWFSVVKQSASDDDSTLNISNVNTGKSEEISHPNTILRSPVISDDESRLAYAAIKQEECFIRVHTLSAPLTYEQGEDIYRCHFDKTNVSMSWSADNKFLYFTDRHNTNSAYALYELSIESRSVKQLNEISFANLGAYSIALSNDGSKLAYLASNYWDRSTLYTYDFNSGQSNKVHEFTFLPWSVAWENDDKSVIYSDSQTPGKLLSLDLDNGYTRIVYESPDLLFKPQFHLNSNTILVTQISTDIDIHAFALNFDAPKLTNIQQDPSINSSRVDEAPKFSHSGESVAFVTHRNGFAQLAVKTNADITLHTPFSKTRRVDEYTWDNKDQGLFMQSGDARISYLNLTDKSVSRWGSNNPSVHPFVVKSYPGIYFSTLEQEQWNIWYQSSVNSKPRQISENGGYNGVGSYDNTTIFFTKFNQSGVWKVALSENTAKEEIKVLSDVPHRSQLASCENGLFFTRLSREKTDWIELWALNTSTQKESLLRTFATGQYFKYSVSPDCGSLLYSNWDKVESTVIRLSH